MELTSFHSISICCSKKEEVYTLGRYILRHKGMTSGKGETYWTIYVLSTLSWALMLAKISQDSEWGGEMAQILFSWGRNKPRQGQGVVQITESQAFPITYGEGSSGDCLVSQRCGHDGRRGNNPVSSFNRAVSWLSCPQKRRREKREEQFRHGIQSQIRSQIKSRD